jgi:hypothetical protein
MGKTQSKTLSGTAWARHGMCELDLNYTRMKSEDSINSEILGSDSGTAEQSNLPSTVTPWGLVQLPTVRRDPTTCIFRVKQQAGSPVVMKYLTFNKKAVGYFETSVTYTNGNCLTSRKTWIFSYSLSHSTEISIRISNSYQYTVLGYNKVTNFSKLLKQTQFLGP